ncbi:hypothetical protein AAG570_003374 [Ranatra chinensis]|uniref:Arginase n=1 Tax=Ranatra chinensis TaxID=642074 RepID=A0ABD0Y3E2_9HEMI
MVKEVVSSGRIAVNLGGDHSVAVGTVDGHSRGTDKRVSLLWVDAHADLNTSSSSPSGNAHGMPVSLLVKELEEDWPDTPAMEWQRPRLLINNVGFIGLRDLDPYEREVLKRFNVAAYGMEEVDRYGIVEVTKMALNRINPDGVNALHLSFDVDSLDIHEAPCTGTPVRGGLSLREAMQVMEIVRDTGTLSALDVVEINPLLGNDRQAETTVRAAVHVIKTLFGRCRFDSAPS